MPSKSFSMDQRRAASFRGRICGSSSRDRRPRERRPYRDDDDDDLDERRYQYQDVDHRRTRSSSHGRRRRQLVVDTDADAAPTPITVQSTSSSSSPHTPLPPLLMRKAVGTLAKLISAAAAATHGAKWTHVLQYLDSHVKADERVDNVKLPFESPLPAFVVPSDTLRQELMYDKETGDSLLRICLQKAAPLRIMAALCHLGPEALMAADPQGRIPLHYATRYPVTSELDAVMQLFIQARPDSLLQRDSQGRTPLHYLFWYHAPHRTPSIVHQFCVPITKTRFYCMKQQRVQTTPVPGCPSMSPNDCPLPEIPRPISHKQMSTSTSATAVEVAVAVSSPPNNAAIVPDAAHGCIPLHYAVMMGARLDSIQVLLTSYPLSKTVQDRHGRTALHWYLGAGSLWLENTPNCSSSIAARKDVIAPENKNDNTARIEQGKHESAASQQKSAPTASSYPTLVSGERVSTEQQHQHQQQPWHQHCIHADLVAMLLSSAVARTADRWGRHPLHWAAQFLAHHYYGVQQHARERAAAGQQELNTNERQQQDPTKPANYPPPCAPPGQALTAAIVQQLLDHYVGQLYAVDYQSMTPLTVLLHAGAQLLRQDAAASAAAAAAVQQEQEERSKHSATPPLKPDLIVGGPPALDMPTALLELFLQHPDGIIGAAVHNVATIEDDRGRLPLHHAASAAAAPHLLHAILQWNPMAVVHEEAQDQKVPLHAALDAAAAPWQTAETMQVLLGAYTAGRRVSHKQSQARPANAVTMDGRLALKMEDASGMYPLHYAALHQASWTVLASLVQAYPKTVVLRNGTGDLPLHALLQPLRYNHEQSRIQSLAMTRKQQQQQDIPVPSQDSLYETGNAPSRSLPSQDDQDEKKEEYDDDDDDDFDDRSNTTSQPEDSAKSLMVVNTQIDADHDSNAVDPDDVILWFATRHKLQLLLRYLPVLDASSLALPCSQTGYMPLHAAVQFHAATYPQLAAMLEHHPAAATHFTTGVGTACCSPMDFHEWRRPAVAAPATMISTSMLISEFMPSLLLYYGATSSPTDCFDDDLGVDGKGGTSIKSLLASHSVPTHRLIKLLLRESLPTYTTESWLHVRELLFSYGPVLESHRHRQELLDQCVRIVVSELNGVGSYHLEQVQLAAQKPPSHSPLVISHTVSVMEDALGHTAKHYGRTQRRKKEAAVIAAAAAAGINGKDNNKNDSIKRHKGGGGHDAKTRKRSNNHHHHKSSRSVAAAAAAAVAVLGRSTSSSSRPVGTTTNRRKRGERLKQQQQSKSSGKKKAMTTMMMMMNSPNYKGISPDDRERAHDPLLCKATMYDDDVVGFDYNDDDAGTTTDEDDDDDEEEDDDDESLFSGTADELETDRDEYDDEEEEEASLADSSEFDDGEEEASEADVDYASELDGGGLLSGSNLDTTTYEEEDEDDTTVDSRSRKLRERLRQRFQPAHRRAEALARRQPTLEDIFENAKRKAAGWDSSATAAADSSPASPSPATVRKGNGKALRKSRSNGTGSTSAAAHSSSSWGDVAAGTPRAENQESKQPQQHVLQYDRPSYLSEVGLRLWTFFVLYCDTNNPSDTYVQQVATIFAEIGFTAVEELVTLPLPPYARQYLRVLPLPPQSKQQLQQQLHMNGQDENASLPPDCCFRDVASPKCRELIHRTCYFVGRYDFDVEEQSSAGGILVRQNRDCSAVTVQATEWAFITAETTDAVLTGVSEAEIWKTGEIPAEVGATFRSQRRTVWIQFTMNAAAYHRLLLAHEILHKRQECEDRQKSAGAVVVPLIAHYNAFGTERQIDRTYHTDIRDPRFCTLALFDDDDDEEDCGGNAAVARPRECIHLPYYPFCVVYPSCAVRGSLDQYLIQQGGVRAMDDVRYVARQVACSLAELHRYGICHGCVSLENIVWYNPGRSEDDSKCDGGRWCLTNLSHSTTSAVKSYLGGIDAQGWAQFSTGSLPPEMFVRLSPDELKVYWKYWQTIEGLFGIEMDRSAIEPIVDFHTGEAYVVKCYFSPSLDDSGSTDDADLPHLPYELVPYTASADLWCFGQIIFYLTSNGRSIGTTSALDGRLLDYGSLSRWDVATASSMVYEYVEDALAQDLILRLLSNTDQRNQDNMSSILQHPFLSGKIEFSEGAITAAKVMIEKRSNESATHRRRLQNKAKELYEEHWLQERNVTLTKCWDLDLLERIHHSPSEIVRGLLPKQQQIFVPGSFLLLPYRCVKREDSTLFLATDSDRNTAERMGHMLLDLSKACYFASLLKRASIDNDHRIRWSTSDLLTRLAISPDDFSGIKSKMTDLASIHVESFRDDPFSIALKLVQESLTSLLTCFDGHDVNVYLVDEYRVVPSSGNRYPITVPMKQRDQILHNGMLFMVLTSLYARGVTQDLTGLASLLGLDLQKPVPASWLESARGLNHSFDIASHLDEISVLQDALSTISSSKHRLGEYDFWVMKDFLTEHDPMRDFGGFRRVSSSGACIWTSTSGVHEITSIAQGASFHDILRKARK